MIRKYIIVADDSIKGFDEGIAKLEREWGAEEIEPNEALDMAIQALEQTDKIAASNFSTEQYKADLQGAYDCGYNCGYTDAMFDIAEGE